MNQPLLRRILLSALALAGGLCVTQAAGAATVKGSISLPAELKTGRRFVGHWRVENTNVAVQGAGQRNGTVVLIVGPQYQAVPPKTVSVEIAGLAATPSAIVVSEGTVVEFKNSDKVAHDLSVPGQSQIMPPERLGSGTVRKQRFATAGEYLVRCTEYPHIVVSVIVTSSPLFDVVDEKGGFRVEGVPEGPAKLKVWSNGRWVHEEDINVGARGLDMAVKVQGANNKEAAE